MSASTEGATRKALYEFVNILLAVVGQSQAVHHLELEQATAPLQPISRACTWFRGHPFDDCPCYDRDTIRAGHSWQGPALVAGRDSTIVVPPGWNASCDAFGNLLISRAGAEA